MRRYLHTTREERQFIANAFGVGERIVMYALAFERDSELAKKIRVLAIKRGAVMMVENPEVETIFDSDGYMRQYFPNGVEIEGNKNTGAVRILHKGCQLEYYSSLTLYELCQIQRRVSRMSF